MARRIVIRKMGESASASSEESPKGAEAAVLAQLTTFRRNCGWESCRVESRGGGMDTGQWKVTSTRFVSLGVRAI